MKITKEYILSFIVVLLIGAGIFLIFYLSLKDFPIECDEYKQVKFRYVGSGGFFGGIEKIEVHGDSSDGTMPKCVKGTNIFGGKV